MKLSEIKHLVNLLESRGVNDDFNLKFVCNLAPENYAPLIEDFVLDRSDNDFQRFDIGHSDKVVNIFLEHIFY